MIDSTGSGHVVDQRTTRATELVVEGNTCGKREKALQEAFSDAGKGARAVTLEGQDVLAARKRSIRSFGGSAPDGVRRPVRRGGVDA